MSRLKVKSINEADKWKPGHYVKISDDHLISPSIMSDIYGELDATPALRGIKIVLLWGRYESTLGNYDFSDIDTIVEALRSRGRYLHISIAWKEFTAAQTVTRILPSYLQATDGSWDDTAAGLDHTAYKYAWAYKNSSGDTTLRGYNMKLWPQVGDPNGTNYLRDRLDAFFQALSDRYDNDPVVTHITTNEGSLATPVATMGGGTIIVNGSGYNTNLLGSTTLQEYGQEYWARSLRSKFVKTPVSFGLNFTRAMVADQFTTTARYPSIIAGNIGINTPNCNWKDSINTTVGNPGILTYYPTYTNVVNLAAEIQGDEYDSTVGNDAAVADYDFPSYKQLFIRTTKDLHSNYCIWLRRTEAAYPSWQGGVATGSTYPNGWNGTTFQSVLTFLQTDKDILAGGISGGCNPKKPTNF